MLCHNVMASESLPTAHFVLCMKPTHRFSRVSQYGSSQGHPTHQVYERTYAEKGEKYRPTPILLEPDWICPSDSPISRKQDDFCDANLVDTKLRTEVSANTIHTVFG